MESPSLHNFGFHVATLLDEAKQMRSGLSSSILNASNHYQHQLSATLNANEGDLRGSGLTNVLNRGHLTSQLPLLYAENTAQNQFRQVSGIDQHVQATTIEFDESFDQFVNALLEVLVNDLKRQCKNFFALMLYGELAGESNHLALLSTAFLLDKRQQRDSINVQLVVVDAETNHHHQLTGGLANGRQAINQNWCNIELILSRREGTDCQLVGTADFLCMSALRARALCTNIYADPSFDFKCFSLYLPEISYLNHKGK